MRKDFCLCFNEGYVPYACVTIKSIMDNANPEDDVVIHIVSDYLSNDSLEFLKQWNVVFHIINDDSIFDGIDSSVWSVYTLYRLFLPKYLETDIHKVLYLDCDVIVNDNLNELFEMDMRDRAIAGCIDPQTYSEEVFARLNYGVEKKYICAGVLLMNLDYWRENDLTDKVVEYMKSNPDKIAFLEQDALNFLCSENKIILPAEYGVQCSFLRDNRFLVEHIDSIESIVDNPKIVHYAGYAPWVYCKNKSLHSHLWWKTYKSLKAYPMVKMDYGKSIIKYFGRYVLSKLHLIGSDSKFHVNQYYDHPRVTRESVNKLIQELK